MNSRLINVSMKNVNISLKIINVSINFINVSPKIINVSTKTGGSAYSEPPVSRIHSAGNSGSFSR